MVLPAWLHPVVRNVLEVVRAPATRGAVILFLGTTAAGAANYLYNVLMAREQFLGPEGFGTLAALSAFLGLEGVLVTTLATAVAGTVARFSARGAGDTPATLIRRLTFRVFGFTLLIVVLLAVVSRGLATFFHLSSPLPLFFLLPSLMLTPLLGITTGALQGALAFAHLSLVSLIGAGSRLGLSVLLVAKGRGVAAVVGVMGVAFLLSYVYSLYALRRVLRLTPREGQSGSPPVGRGESDVALPAGDTSVRPRGFTGPVFLVVLGLTALFSLDVVLAKRFLSPADAGLYSGLSVLGRIIYFLCLPVTLTMFPHVARRAARAQSSRRILWVTGGVIALCAGAFLILYRLAPVWIVRRALGETYVWAAETLWIFGLFFACVTFATWALHVFLALGRTRLAFLPLLAAALQLLLIFRYHTSLTAVVGSSLAAAALLCVALGLVAVRGLRLRARVLSASEVQ